MDTRITARVFPTLWKRLIHRCKLQVLNRKGLELPGKSRRHSWHPFPRGQIRTRAEKWGKDTKGWLHTGNHRWNHEKLTCGTYHILLVIAPHIRTGDNRAAGGHRSEYVDKYIFEPNHQRDPGYHRVPCIADYQCTRTPTSRAISCSVLSMDYWAVKLLFDKYFFRLFNHETSLLSL